MFPCQNSYLVLPMLIFDPLFDSSECDDKWCDKLSKGLFY